MRRTLTTITAISAALALTACNGDATTTDETGNGTPVVGTTDDDDATEEPGPVGTTDEDEATEGAGGAADDSEATGDAAGDTAGATDPVCTDFFEGQGTPLAERAEEQLEVVGAGDELDPASFSQVSLLESRISGLVEQADGEHADLLERINAPFTEVVESVVAEDAGNEPEITIPQVETDDAEQALDELEQACAG